MFPADNGKTGFQKCMKSICESIYQEELRMKKILSLVLSFLLASSAFVVTAGAVDFANPKFEESYAGIGWDYDYSYEKIIVVIDMEKYDRNEILTAEDFPDVALSEVRAISEDDCRIYTFYLANPGRDEVRAVIEALAPYEIVESAMPLHYLSDKYADILMIEVGNDDPKYNIDSDGKITLKDVNGMIRHIAGCAELSADELVKADINGDGKVNLRDVKCFIDHMSGRK